jgi:hypothetical protein
MRDATRRFGKYKMRLSKLDEARNRIVLEKYPRECIKIRKVGFWVVVDGLGMEILQENVEEGAGGRLAIRRFRANLFRHMSHDNINTLFSASC